MIYSNEDLERFYNSQSPAPDKESIKVSTQEAIELKSVLLSLQEHNGYVRFQEALRKQISARLTENVQMPKGLDGVTQILYVNGEIAGLKLALDFVNILIDSCSETIKFNERIETAYYPDEPEQNDGQA